MGIVGDVRLIQPGTRRPTVSTSASESKMEIAPVAALQRIYEYTYLLHQNVGGVQAEMTSQAFPPTQRKRCGLRLSK